MGGNVEAVQGAGVELSKAFRVVSAFAVNLFCPPNLPDLDPIPFSICLVNVTSLSVDFLGKSLNRNRTMKVLACLAAMVQPANHFIKRYDSLIVALATPSCPALHPLEWKSNGVCTNCIVQCRSKCSIFHSSGCQSSACDASHCPFIGHPTHA